MYLLGASFCCVYAVGKGDCDSEVEGVLWKIIRCITK